MTPEAHAAHLWKSGYNDTRSLKTICRNISAVASEADKDLSTRRNPLLREIYDHIDALRITAQELTDLMEP